jgi:hypothetical protein
MQVQKHMGWRYTFRYLTGRPLNGRIYTDCGYFRPGRKVLHPTGHASRWAHLPGWKRQAFRVWPPFLSIAFVTGLATHPVWTWAVTVTAAVGIGIPLFRSVSAQLSGWNFNRTVRKPMTQALVPFTQMFPDEIDKGLILGKDEVRVPLAPHHAGQLAVVADIKRIVSQRLDGDWAAELNMRQLPFYVRLTPLPEPPQKVVLSNIIDAIYATDVDHPVIGIGAGNVPVKLDFTGEIAHLACSIGTGGGKSAFCRLLISQLLYHGCNDVRIFDVKLVSLAELASLPGVTYYRHVEECWKGIAQLRAEMDSRYDILLQNAKATFNPIYVVLEEQNSFFEESDIHWKHDLGNKGKPPVWSDVAMLLLKARQVNIRLIGMYQRMSARVSGGGDLRDQYGQKFLSRFSHQAWDSLVGTRPRGRSSAIPGRAISILGAEHKTVQVAYCEPDEAVALALENADVTVTAPTNHQFSEPVTVNSDKIPPRRYSFAEAARQPWCTVSYDTLKQRASRAKVSSANKLTQDEILDLLGEKR